MTVSVDVSELRRLAVDLDRSAADVAKGIQAVVAKGAVNLRQMMRDDMRESPSFAPIASAITFDLRVSGDGVEAEVGPRKGSPGSLANIAYFGGSNGGGGTVDIMGPLGEEAPRFEQALVDLIDGAVLP